MVPWQVCVCVCSLRLGAWFKSFAEGARFDCNAACCVLKRESAAAFRLVSCQDWSLKGGPLTERGGGSHQGGPGGGGLVIDLLVFESPLCGLQQQKGPPSHEEERESELEGGCWHIDPCTREHGQVASSPVKVTDQMFLVVKLLAFNKLSYCKSV